MAAEEKMDLCGKISPRATKVILPQTYNTNARQSKVFVLMACVKLGPPIGNELLIA